MEVDLDEEWIEDVRLDDERECHWRIFFREIREGWIIRNIFYIRIVGVST